ncbi:amidohydrolase family protein [Streptomyces sp. Tu102]|uniref:amidohydrolase family protein n=1 Tax=Streptomyces TaxID=1883 RepID=UPI0027E57A89|nr:amidohydrolase family protein [Streptomyces sp. Tu102]
MNGARACGLARRTGSITPGKDADIILLRTDDLTVLPANNPIGTLVTAGHPGLVVGRVVKRNGTLRGINLPALTNRLTTSRDRVAAAANISLDGTWHPNAPTK